MNPPQTHKRLMPAITALLPIRDDGAPLWTLEPQSEDPYYSEFTLTSTQLQYVYWTGCPRVTRHLRVNTVSQQITLTDPSHLTYLDRTGWQYDPIATAALLSHRTQFHAHSRAATAANPSPFDPVYTTLDSRHDQHYGPALTAAGTLDHLPLLLDDFAKADNRISRLRTCGLYPRAPIAWYLARWYAIHQSGTDLDLLTDWQPIHRLALTVYDEHYEPTPLPWAFIAPPIRGGNHYNLDPTDPLPVAKALNAIEHQHHAFWDSLLHRGLDPVQLANLKPGQHFTITRI